MGSEMNNHEIFISQMQHLLFEFLYHIKVSLLNFIFTCNEKTEKYHHYVVKERGIVTIVEKIYNNIEQRHLAALIIIRH
jgi:hypothetical protein